MPKVFEKAKAGDKPGQIELVADGMIVHFPYHNPRKYFFDPAKWLEALQKNTRFSVLGFHTIYIKSKVEIVLDKSVSGHNRMRLSKKELMEALTGMYPDAK